MLEVEGEGVDLREGHAVFVPAGAEHRFSAYEQLSVLVIFERRSSAAAVVVDGLRVVRGGVPVLDGLSLEVRAGAVTASSARAAAASRR